MPDLIHKPSHCLLFALLLSVFTPPTEAKKADSASSLPTHQRTTPSHRVTCLPKDHLLYHYYTKPGLTLLKTGLQKLLKTDPEFRSLTRQLRVRNRLTDILMGPDLSLKQIRFGFITNSARFPKKTLVEKIEKYCSGDIWLSPTTIKNENCLVYLGLLEYKLMSTTYDDVPQARDTEVYPDCPPRDLRKNAPGHEAAVRG